MFEVVREMGFALMWALTKGAVYGLAAALAVLIVARRVGLLERDGRFRRLIAKLYQLYVPIVFAGVGAIWVASAQAEKVAVAAFESVRPEITAQSERAARDMLSVVVQRAERGNTSIKDLVLVVAREYVEERFMPEVLQASKLPDSVRKLTGIASGAIARTIVAALEERIIEALADKMSISPEMLRTVWDVKILGAMHDGLVADIIATHLHKPFDHVASSARMTGFLLLLPVVLETAAYFFIRRRRQKNAPVVESSV